MGEKGRLARRGLAKRRPAAGVTNDERDHENKRHSIHEPFVFVVSHVVLPRAARLASPRRASSLLSPFSCFLVTAKTA